MPREGLHSAKLISRLSGFILALAIAGAASETQARIPQVVTKLSQLSDPVAETVVALDRSRVRVLIADYALIRQDFVSTRTMSEAQIDRWLIEHAAFISLPQTHQLEVNTPIALENKGAVKKKAWRPFLYNRALVIPVEDNRFIDVKGAGSLSPHQDSHGNGLMATYEGLREFFVEKKMEQILRDALSKFNTVGCYAVLDYGFNIVHADGSESPAGGVLRQGQERRSRADAESLGNSFLPEAEALEAELTVRKYGFTFSGEGSWRQDVEYYFGAGDALNVQGNLNHEIIDFGPARVYSSFSRPLYSYLSFIYGVQRLYPVIEPGDSAFIQPDPHKALSEQEWGRSKSSKLELKQDQIGADTKAYVDSFLKGVMSRKDIETQFNKKMASGPYATAKAYTSMQSMAGPVSCEALL